MILAQHFDNANAKYNAAHPVKVVTIPTNNTVAKLVGTYLNDNAMVLDFLHPATFIKHMSKEGYEITKQQLKEVLSKFYPQ